MQTILGLWKITSEDKQHFFLNHLSKLPTRSPSFPNVIFTVYCLQKRTFSYSPKTQPSWFRQLALRHNYPLNLRFHSSFITCSKMLVLQILWNAVCPLAGSPRLGSWPHIAASREVQLQASYSWALFSQGALYILALLFAGLGCHQGLLFPSLAEQKFWQPAPAVLV